MSSAFPRREKETAPRLAEVVSRTENLVLEEGPAVLNLYQAGFTGLNAATSIGS
jgi:hypothetical protein